MKDKNYNWWDDPKNQDEVKRISWWNHADNRTTFPFPVSVVQSKSGWVATCNDETKTLIGDRLHGCAQGKTKDEAIEQMFKMIKFSHQYSEDCRLRYQRWVPFRKGSWKDIGGYWFTVFGIHFSFRYGKYVKYGWFVPGTYFNISIHNEWSTYRRYKLENKSN